MPEIKTLIHSPHSYDVKFTEIGPLGIVEFFGPNSPSAEFTSTQRLKKHSNQKKQSSFYHVIPIHSVIDTHQWDVRAYPSRLRRSFLLYAVVQAIVIIDGSYEISN